MSGYETEVRDADLVNDLHGYLFTNRMMWGPGIGIYRFQPLAGHSCMEVENWVNDSGSHEKCFVYLYRKDLNRLIIQRRVIRRFALGATKGDIRGA